VQQEALEHYKLALNNLFVTKFMMLLDTVIEAYAEIVNLQMSSAKTRTQFIDP